MPTPPTDARRLSQPPPRPLQLSNLNTDFHSGFPSPSASSTPDSALSAPPATTRKPSARRQGSIVYLPHDSSPRYDFRSPNPVSRLKRNNSVDSRISTLSTTRGSRRSTGSIVKPEQPPLTLADKHADLLRFIAQKESRCMELRSQLIAHEAELTQLKRKWEKIVSRGFDRVVGVNGSGSMAPQNSAVPGGQVSGSTKGGVHGAGRLLAASPGGEYADAPTAPPATTNPTRTHPIHQSTSSVTTSSSVSARFSQSSINSSVAEDDFPLESPKEEEEKGRKVLIVEEVESISAFSPSSTVNMSNVVDISNVKQDQTARMLRRRSRDVSPSTEERPASTLEANRTKVSTPVLPIPGLGNLPPGTPSWVISTVGKKWEELQRTEAFAKNQKRASLLLSDMSQSLMNAWSSPIASPAFVSGPTNPLVVSFPPTSPLSRRSASTSSLLDSDGDFYRGLGAVMTPDSKSASRPSGVCQRHTPLATSTAYTQDDDEDWNW